MKWDNLIVKLSESEYEKLTRPIVGRGGHQMLLRSISIRLNHRMRTIELNPAQLEKVRIYAGRYGGGGYQDRFAAILEAAERGRPKVKGR